MVDASKPKENEVRRRWMGVLAKARPDEIEAVWAKLDSKPKYGFLRRPEIGLLMLEGRMGGNGRAFNFGEITVTRCALRIDGGLVGHAVVAGRSLRHAELAAAFDALMQDADKASDIETNVIGPLAEAQAQRREEAGRKAAATKVEFFTMTPTRE